jgi:hypothetical protein
VDVKVALTERAELTVVVHVAALPVQSPDQPLNAEPAAGAAVSVTLVPETKALEQVVPQSIPAGELVTVPVPVPLFVTVSP